MADKKRKRRRRKRRKGHSGLGKKIGIFFGALIGTLAVAYLGAGAYFTSHFSPCTKINGMKVAGKSVAQAEKMIQEELDGYVLKVTDAENHVEEVQATDIGLKYVSDGTVKKIKKEQGGFLWLGSLLVGDNINVEYSVEYDEGALDKKVSAFACMNNDEVEAPKNAHPEYKDGEYVIEKEIYGSKVEEETFRKTLNEKLETLDGELVMKDEGCYVAPKYISTSEKVVDACSKMNNYLETKITYDMAGQELPVSKDDLSKMISCSKKMKVTLKEDKVKEYVQKLKDTYDTVGKKRKFKSASGKKAEVAGGSYGWQIDLEAETSQLIKEIKKGEPVNREPNYSQKAKSHEDADWGDTYVDIDLTNQHVYYVSGGKVKMDCDVVTGNLSAGNGTPAGVFPLAYKERNRTLRGPKKDGKYEWESPVSYWMPFNGGIGLHDATWRSSFGGGIYKTNGSHGCVNMPVSKAKELFGYIDSGTPIVCHY